MFSMPPKTAMVALFVWLLVAKHYEISLAIENNLNSFQWLDGLQNSVISSLRFGL